MIRAVSEWKEILSGLSNENASKRIFSDLVGYRESSTHTKTDALQLGNALHAWHLLTQERVDAGRKIVEEIQKANPNG